MMKASVKRAVPHRLETGQYGRFLTGFAFAVPILVIQSLFSLASADMGDQPIQFSSDHTTWDRKANMIYLEGHATVREPGEDLSADKITLDQSTRILDAQGNCVYITADSVINGDEMHFNMDTRTGTIVGGRVSNDRFSLIGERINKLGEGKFQTHWGEYSTCRDCPQAWSLLAEDVDLTFGGYAYMSNVTTKIKEAPAFWLPYLVIPVKSKRQSGLLFPTFRVASSTDGIVFVLPYFWAINDWSDMTLGLGYYSRRGTRAEAEGRYAFTPTSTGKVNFYHIMDRTFAEANGTLGERWGLDVTQRQLLPFGFDEKLRLREVSDNNYPIDFVDINRGGEMELASDLIISNSTPYVSGYVAGKRLRNILPVDPTAAPMDFDNYSVQALPTAELTTNDQFLFGSPIAAGFSLGFSNFTRTAQGPDLDLLPATPLPIYRSATRVAVSPSLYTTLRPWDVVSVIPSLQYNSYFYSFHNDIPNLEQGYLLFQTEMSTSFERIYETSNPDVPRMKHTIRPFLIYSQIPPQLHQQTGTTTDAAGHSVPHPFVQQILAGQSEGVNYNFDSYDIVPVDVSPNEATYFTPLGNSLTYGFDTQLIKRKGRLDSPYATYVKAMEFSASQTIDFNQFTFPTDLQQPVGRFSSELDFFFDQWTSSTTYYWYPYVPTPRDVVSTFVTYTFESAMHQRILTYNRSVNFGFSRNQLNCFNASCGTIALTGAAFFSLNDYILPSANFQFSAVSHDFLTATGGVTFQSPSRCYQVSVAANYSVQPIPNVNFSFDLALNLSGEGFGGFSQAANQAMAPK